MFLPLTQGGNLHHLAGAVSARQADIQPIATRNLAERSSARLEQNSHWCKDTWPLQGLLFLTRCCIHPPKAGFRFEAQELL